jgi:hypothetical protein
MCIDYENNLYSETEFKEIYPNSKDFGIWAWTCLDLFKVADRVKLLNTKTEN